MPIISDELLKILKECFIQESDIERLISEVKQESSQDSNRESFNYQMPQNDWGLLDDTSWAIWHSERDLKEKIKLGFEFFSIFPNYYFGLQPMYEIFRDDLIRDEEIRKDIFDEFAKYLSSNEDYYHKSVEYILWVEFFEHGEDLGREAWNSILNSKNLTLEGKLNLLKCSGPADYDLKENLYYELLARPETHQYIFDSLLYSATDLYGKIEKDDAIKILSRLEGIDKKSERYKILQSKLGLVEII